ncbi:MAG TPA: pantoate--beta-alanine ligase [Streptosporangiaceae bacterium]
MTELLQTRASLAKIPRSGTVVLVPTMGALHDGHRALLRAARAVPDACVVVSVFVNPLQFGPGEDLDRYPRTLAADLDMCEAEGTDLVFAPSALEMYPDGQPKVTVNPGLAGQVLEGEFRPGFFGGVLTVVLKLVSLVRPDIAVFGEKDAQQLALIRAMVTDLDLGLSITGVPTVREPDGLAMSSRNRYLSDAERTTALALSGALRAGVSAAANGAEGVLAAAQRVLGASPGLSVDYLALVDPSTFAAVTAAGPAVLAAAARVGTTRLIDNMPLVIGGAPDAADR